MDKKIIRLFGYALFAVLIILLFFFFTKKDKTTSTEENIEEVSPTVTELSALKKMKSVAPWFISIITRSFILTLQQTKQQKLQTILVAIFPKPTKTVHFLPSTNKAFLLFTATAKDKKLALK